MYTKIQPRSDNVNLNIKITYMFKLMTAMKIIVTVNYGKT